MSNFSSTKETFVSYDERELIAVLIQVGLAKRGINCDYSPEETASFILNNIT